jgi:hypothetical protein
VARTVRPETQIQTAICEYLALKNQFFIRLNNIPGLYIDRDGNKRFRRMGKFARPGLADILVIRDGQPVFIEVKSEKGKPSDEQMTDLFSLSPFRYIFTVPTSDRRPR